MKSSRRAPSSVRLRGVGGAASSGSGGSLVAQAQARRSPPRGIVLTGDLAKQATRAKLEETVAARAARTTADTVATGGRLQNMADELAAARTAGYEDGFRAGLAEAISSMEAERLETARKLAMSIADAAGVAATSRAEMLSGIEKEVVDLAVKTAGAILDRELVVSHSPGKEAVVRALKLVPAGEDLEVRLNPDDMVDVAEVRELVGDVNVAVVADASVERGGCVVQAGPARIDAQVSAALERVANLLGSVVPSESAPAGGLGTPLRDRSNPVNGDGGGVELNVPAAEGGDE